MACGQARLNNTEEMQRRRKEAEREQRVRHLLTVAIKRTLKLELAKGWTQWLDQTKHAKENRMRAVAR